MNAYDITFSTLDGAELPLSSFKGRAILVVNVASSCGFTPQYGPMQAMSEEFGGAEFGDQGPVVIGVPCNDFGAQEPGTNEAIGTFCETRFGVTFPITNKIAILDAQARHPFYQWVQATLGEDALPKWNFHKYVIDAHGELVASFGSRTGPDAPEVREALGV
jgi:glutathione peroxidase